MAKKKQLHEKLGITFAELGALLGTKAMLELAVVTGTNECMYDDDYDSALMAAGIHVFDMNTAATTYACGSVSCIGGTMGLIMGKTSEAARTYVGCAVPRDNFYYRYSPGTLHSPSLHPLFFPSIASEDSVADKWRGLTRQQAVKAINNFLGGKCKNPWKGVTK